jgi:hypothetical protein
MVLAQVLMKFQALLKMLKLKLRKLLLAKLEENGLTYQSTPPHQITTIQLNLLKLLISIVFQKLQR